MNCAVFKFISKAVGVYTVNSNLNCVCLWNFTTIYYEYTDPFKEVVLNILLVKYWTGP